jgi:pimeloyl-ACP methyl ester carboxylesterase
VQQQPIIYMTKAVVFIHGAWLTPAVWDHFLCRYAACGYSCMAPAWPLLDQPISRLQDNPPDALATLSIGRIVAHYERLIRAQSEPPVLVGHSFGGLFVQMLLDRGLGAAGVAINPVPPRGVLPGFTALRSALPFLLHWAGWARTLRMTESQFSRNFAQTLSPPELDSAYRSHIIPAPSRIFYQAALGIGNQVNFSNDYRAPLLFIAGGKDRTIQASMVTSNYRRHRRSAAVTALLRFPGRSHWLIAEPGWEEVADASIEWLQSNSGCRF